MRISHRAVATAIVFLGVAGVEGAGALAQPFCRPDTTRRLATIDRPSGLRVSDLATDPAGNLYGVTRDGGGSAECPKDGCGTIFRLLRPATPDAPWTQQTLFAFARATSGARPLGRPLIGRDGAVYGTASEGGTVAGQPGSGTVWRLLPPGQSGAWSLSVLHTFPDPAASATVDGTHPETGLVADRAGRLYGTTPDGGGPGGVGTVFALTPPAAGGAAWSETLLHVFGTNHFNGSPEGANPSSRLTVSKDDKWLFGATSGSTGGDDPNLGGGTVYGLRRQPGGGWHYGVLFTFYVPCSDGVTCYYTGSFPSGDLAVDQHLDVFGTAEADGRPLPGAVFEVSPPAPGQTAWSESVLAVLPVTSGLVLRERTGTLFGTTGYAGAIDCSHGFGGSTFRLDPLATSGAGWSLTLLHSFGSPTGRGQPFDPVRNALTLGPDHLLYGVATGGGRSVVFLQRPD